VHKDFYASGFLIHLPTQQILLQKHDLVDTSSQWSLFGEHSASGEDAIKTFQRAVYEQLHLKLKTPAIYSVYDYMHDGLKKVHFVHYASIDSIDQKMKPRKDHILSWFNFKQMLKIPISEQTKQDIIVAQRVINVVVRQQMEEQQPPQEQAT
jgi:ADP-ribose pyrophosphatase YjhB (NUDIX family)